MHDNEPREWIVGEPSRTIVFAHGRNGSPEGMRGFAERLDLDDVRYLFLEADDSAWYPNGFMAPIADNEPKLTAALEHVEAVVAGLLEDGTPAHEIWVGGFSQGACLAAEWLARTGHPVGGAIILTGGLIGPDGHEWDTRTELAGMPVYLSSARNDEWIPLRRFDETREWFEGCEVDLTCRLFDERPHQMSDVEVDDLRELLRTR